MKNSFRAQHTAAHMPIPAHCPCPRGPQAKNGFYILNDEKNLKKNDIAGHMKITQIWDTWGGSVS